jgi:hypothetical protein
MMWKGTPGWQQRKCKFVREESSIEGILEGVGQCFITAFIIVQKYVEKDEHYGYHVQDFTSSSRESFGVMTLIFLCISSVGSLLSGILGIYYFMVEGPLKIKLGEGVGNKILIFAVIIFGLASRFGSLAVVFMFSTALEPSGYWLQLLTYISLGFGFIGIQLIISLIPLMSFKPKKFFRLVFSFPHILIVPLVTPFTYGLVCSSGCRCHCCSCCGCPSPGLALSRRTSLTNLAVTLLLMVPPVIFFDWISSWYLAAAQLAIGALGLVTAPVLLLQPGRIVQLGVLNPDCLNRQLLALVEGSGRWGGFRLGATEEESQLEEEGVEAEMENFVAKDGSGANSETNDLSMQVEEPAGKTMAALRQKIITALPQEVQDEFCTEEEWDEDRTATAGLEP